MGRLPLFQDCIFFLINGAVIHHPRVKCNRPGVFQNKRHNGEHTIRLYVIITCNIFVSTLYLQYCQINFSTFFPLNKPEESAAVKQLYAKLES